MAPSTRLRDQPERRVEYREITRVGSRANPIELDDETPPPVTRRMARTIQTGRKSTGATITRANAAARQTRAGRALLRARQSLRPTITHVDAGAIVKPKTPVKKAVRATAKEKKLLPPKRECSVCVSTKSVSHSFRISKNEEICEHFKNICSQCITKMVVGKIESRQLSEAELACPYPDCDHVLDHTELKMAFTNKEKFKEYDAALAKHFLAANPNFIACLSSKCGKYFSVEDCSVDDKTNKPAASSTKTKAKGSKSTNSNSDSPTKPQKIACPYCSSSLCLTCNRPWHVKTLCSAAAALEDASSVASIKALGAKPCPKCGINIEKQGGCDHMTCHRCRHNFCWQCLVPYTSTVVHAEGCSHGRRDVAVDPRNWLPENMTVAQVNVMIEQARRRRDEPQETGQQGRAPQLVGVPLAPNQNMQGVFLNVANNFLQVMLRGPNAGL